MDLLLLAGLGFLGSFGHCVGMCGPIAIAVALSQEQASRWQQLRFHCLLQFGRIASYGLVGAGIGALGSVLVASGQMAGVGSLVRRGIAVTTGVILIWLGLMRVRPALLPPLPLLHPLMGRSTHRLNQGMATLSQGSRWWTPLFLGLVWGLMPCGFLYVAQIKAAGTSSLGLGLATMVAFGLGTLPVMVGVGASTAWMGANWHGQLFRLGGWVTLIMGALTLLRTGDMMLDYSGHGAIVCLVLALIARPISRLWSWPLTYRRGLGVGAFLLALAHVLHILEHTLDWNFQAVTFLLPQHRWGIWMGLGSLGLLTPLALTSFDQAQRWLGRRWRSLHRLSVLALVLAAIHSIVTGSHYLGQLRLAWTNYGLTLILGLLVGGVLLVRSPWFWSLRWLKKLYVPPPRS